MVKNCGRRLESAFSRPRSQFFTIRTDPKPANNMLIFSCSKLVLQITNGFIYGTLSLNRAARCLIHQIKSHQIKSLNLKWYYDQKISSFFFFRF